MHWWWGPLHCSPGGMIFIESAHWADSIIESRCPYVCLSVCLSVPFHAIFFEASHWPSDHMTRSRPLIGQPSFPTIWWNKTGFWLLRVIRQARPSATRPSYYTRGALKTGGGCRAGREGGGGITVFIFKESALGRFFHRVAMSVDVSLCPLFM